MQVEFLVINYSNYYHLLLCYLLVRSVILLSNWASACGRYAQTQGKTLATFGFPQQEPFVPHGTCFLLGFFFSLPMALCFFPSLCSSSSRYLVPALVVPFSQGSVLIIYSVYHFKHSGFF